jgi:hypothetical protein
MLDYPKKGEIRTYDYCLNGVVYSIIAILAEEYDPQGTRCLVLFDSNMDNPLTNRGIGGSGFMNLYNLHTSKKLV